MMDTPKKTDDIYAAPDYRRSRGAYRAQCTFEYFVSMLVSDAYLAKLLTDIGLSDTLIGIISSFVVAAFLFQLAAIFLVQKVHNVKRVVIVFSSMSQLLFTGLYLIPFIPVSLPVRTALVIGGILLGYFGNYLVTSMLYKWANSFVDPKKRGDYSAGKEMISLITGMVFTAVVGAVIDRYEAIGNLHGGFLFIAAAGLILSVCNFISLLMIAKGRKEEETAAVPFSAVVKNVLGNRNFVNVIFLTILWNFARYLTVGFLGTYKIKDLMLTVGTVQIINIVGNLCRFFVSKPLGRYSDRTSFAKGIELAMCIAALAFACNMFTAPKTWFLIVAYTILFHVSTAGTNQNFFNIVYSYVPKEYFVQATAIKNSIGSIFGFAASLIGSRILAAVQNHGNQIFGMQVYGQQVLSALSLLFIIAAILFTKFVIGKQTVMKQ
ncbi:MAG: MFS transporter [Clostridia bacterium]|nr:MFS transporter [Clostridia bacterium]